MVRPSPLDDPAMAAFAWARYRRLMWWMTGFTTLIVIVACIFLYTRHGLISIHLYIAAALGVAFAMLLTAGLMGLVFLSSGTGHDESIDDPLADEGDQP